MTTGAIFQITPPPPPKKKVQQSRDPSPSPLSKANGTTEESDWKEKQGEKEHGGGGVTGQRGEKRGRSGDEQRADAKTTGVGKLQSLARMKKLSQ